MITKRKGLYLGLLLSLLSVGNLVQAYTITLENKTLLNVHFFVKYGYTGLARLFCKNDEKWVIPGETVRIKVGGCLVKDVKAKVFENGGKFKEVRWRGIRAGGKFTVSGPHKYRGGYWEYRITRK